jgi:hypothetical protein
LGIQFRREIIMEPQNRKDRKRILRERKIGLDDNNKTPNKKRRLPSVDPNEYMKYTTVVILEGGDRYVKAEYIDPISPAELFGKTVFLDGSGITGEVRSVYFEWNRGRLGETIKAPKLIKKEVGN